MAAAPASEILPQFPFFHTGGNEFDSRSEFRMDDAYILCKFGPEVEQQQLLPLLLLPVLLILILFFFAVQLKGQWGQNSASRQLRYESAL